VLDDVAVVDVKRPFHCRLKIRDNSIPSASLYPSLEPVERAEQLRRRGLRLEYATLGWNVEVAEKLAAEGTGPAVVFTSTRDEYDFGPQLYRHGTRGFVPKDELSAERITSLWR